MEAERPRVEEIAKDILKVEVPEEEEVEVYLIRLPSGVVVARTKEELEKGGP